MPPHWAPSSVPGVSFPGHPLRPALLGPGEAVPAQRPPRAPGFAGVHSPCSLPACRLFLLALGSRLHWLGSPVSSRVSLSVGHKFGLLPPSTPPTALASRISLFPP